MGKLMKYTNRTWFVSLAFQPRFIPTYNTALTVDKGEPFPWLRLSPPSESLSVEGGGGGLGGVSLGKGGINLQLSSAGSKFTTHSGTKQKQFSKISTALYLKISNKHSLTHTSNRDEKIYLHQHKSYWLNLLPAECNRITYFNKTHWKPCNSDISFL
jgi:hypothetical protein